MYELDGKIAVIIGASSGIGRATAELLARSGARVAVSARSENALRQLAQTSEKEIVVVPGDASDLSTIERLFSSCETKLGPCDILVNCAGTLDVARVVDATIDQWETTFAVNVRSV